MSKYEEAINAMPEECRTRYLRAYAQHPPALQMLCRQFPPMTTVQFQRHTFWVMGYVEKRHGHHELVLSPIDPFKDATLANTFTGAICPQCCLINLEAN